MVRRMSIWDHMKPAVKTIEPSSVELEPGALRVAWPDGRVDHLPFQRLRQQCPCAGCVDEWTHQRTLAPESVPATIGLREARPAGNYAVQLAFSDGHESGIFTWKLLRELGSATPPGSG
jgi:DUF971 family protein